MNISLAQAKSRVESRMHVAFPDETKSIERLFSFLESKDASAGRSVEMLDLYRLVKPSTASVYCLFMQELEDASIVKKSIYLKVNHKDFASPLAKVLDIPLETYDESGKAVKVLLDHILPKYEFNHWIEF